MTTNYQPSGYYGERNAVDWAQNAALAAFSGIDPGSLLAKLAQIMGGSSAMFGGAITPNAIAAQTFLAPAIAGFFAGPGTPIAGSALSQLTSRAVMGLNLQQAFGSLMNAGGMGAGGMGLGLGVQQSLVDMMQGFERPGVRMADLSYMIAQGTQAGFFRGITDVRQARAQLQNLSRQVIEMSRELSMSIQETSQAMTQAAQLGATGPAAARSLATRMIATAQLTGTDPNNVFSIQMAGAQLGRQFGLNIGAGAEAGRLGWGRIGWAERVGALSQEAIINASGIGGDVGASMLLSRLMLTGMQALDRSQTQWMMAAAIDPRSIASGNIQLDQAKLQGILFGANDPQAIERMRQEAQRNIAMLQQMPAAYATWLRNQPQLMDQFMAGTGGMAPLAFAAAAVSSRGISPDDPNYQLYVARTYAQQTGRPTRGPEFRQILKDVSAAIEAGLIGAGAGVAFEQAAVFGAREKEIGERNAAIAERQRTAQLNNVLERSLGDFERRATAGLVQGAERIANLAALQLGMVGNPAEVSASVLASGGARDYFALAGRVAPTFRDMSAELTRAQSDLARLNEEIERTTDPGRKQELIKRRDELKSGIQSLTSFGARTSSRYWGGRTESYTGTASEIATARGVTGQEIEMIRQRVQESGNIWDSANAAWEQMKSHAAERATIAKFLGMSEEDLNKALEQGTFMDVVAKSAKGGSEALARVLIMGAEKQTGRRLSDRERLALTATATTAIESYREAIKTGKGLAYGEVLRIGGRETVGDRSEVLYEQAKTLATSKFGTAALFEEIGRDITGVANPLARMLQDPAMAEKLKSAATFGDFLKLTGISADRQKQLLDLIPSEYRNAKLTSQDLETMLGGLASKQLADMRKTILASGLLGADAMKAYDEAAGESGAGGEFARSMIAARAALSRGSDQEAMSKATSIVREAVTGILKGSRRDLRAVMGLLGRGGELGQAVAARLERMYNQAQGGWSAEEVAGFGRNFGVDLSQIGGLTSSEIAILQGGGREARELLRNNEDLNRRLTEGLASTLIRSTLATGSQAEGKGGPGGSLGQAIAEGMTAAFSNSAANPLSVKVVNWGNLVPQPTGSIGEQQPPSGETGTTPPAVLNY